MLAALHPERVTGLITVGGYNVQDLASAHQPQPPVQEKAKWYQHYFQTELGRRGLAQNRERVADVGDLLRSGGLDGPGLRQ